MRPLVTSSNLNFVFIITFFEQFFGTKLQDCVQLFLVERHCTVAAHTHTDWQICGNSDARKDKYMDNLRWLMLG